MSSSDWRTLPAAQQPLWPDQVEVAKVRRFLSVLPAITSPETVRALSEQLALAQRGRAFVLQAGDCAEPLGTAAVIGARGKYRVMAAMARVLAGALEVPVIQVGRIAGQFAKPRSRDTDTVDGVVLPSFRGLIVNDSKPLPAARRPNPHRMLSGYHTARLVTDELDRLAAARSGDSGPESGRHRRMWISHEALLLDYEEPFVRCDPHTGLWYLLSTHLPWIGERTRQIDGAHVGFLAKVANPIGCKIGPSATEQDVLDLCQVLDAGRTPGRLTFIARMGANLVGERLPALVRAVERAGYPVIWMCDPMHGNQVTTASGRKTRRISDIIAELHGFLTVMRDCDQWPGGVHLEIAGEDVTECLLDTDPASEEQLHRAYRSLCDGRLSDAQALYVTEQLNTFLGDRPARGDDAQRLEVMATSR